MRKFEIKHNKNEWLVLPNIGESYTADHYNHENVTYNINSIGSRGPEPREDTEMLTLGCSFTFGVGLPEEKCWPYLLSNKMNMNLVNLGSPGDSAVGQVRKTFEYFKEYGHPKIVVAMLPFFRMELPINSESLIPKRIIDKKNYDPLARIEVLPHDAPKYAKAPFDPTDVLIPEIPFYYSHMMLSMLQDYCESHGIKFVWGAWEQVYEETYRYVKRMNPKVYRNYCNLTAGYWARDVKNGKLIETYLKEDGCHVEYSDDYFFYGASDLEQGPMSAHSGFHKNIHIAEEFYEKINE
jgi:hypothetical protein